MLIMMNKPRGYLTARSDRTRPTVMELLPPALRALHPVGRLDMDTEGLLLLTDDGDLDRRLLRPEQHVEKLYSAGWSRRTSTGWLRASFWRAPASCPGLPEPGPPAIPPSAPARRCCRRKNTTT